MEPLLADEARNSQFGGGTKGGRAGGGPPEGGAGGSHLGGGCIFGGGPGRANSGAQGLGRGGVGRLPAFFKASPGEAGPFFCGVPAGEVGVPASPGSVALAGSAGRAPAARSELLAVGSPATCCDGSGDGAFAACYYHWSC